MKGLLYIVLFCLGFYALGQKPYVELQVSSNTIELNESFTITVKSNMQGNLNINMPESFVNGNNVMNRMETEYNQSTGEMVTFMYYSRNGSMKKTGKYTFGPAYVSKGNKVYKSNTVQVSVKEVGITKEEITDQNILRKPACGVILTSKQEVYVGEPLCIEAKVISKFSPTHYESYETYSCNPITETHDLSKKDQVTVRLEGGRNQRFVFEHDKKLVFPQKVGNLVIEPFELMLQSGFDSYPVTSSRTVVRVKALPAGAPKSFNGAVGDFVLLADFEQKSKREGDIIPLEITLKGTGNLHEIQLPKPKLTSGWRFYGDPETKEKFAFNENGASGAITCTYYVVCDKTGAHKSPYFELAYFDLESKKYKVLRTKMSMWEILDDPKKQIEGENKSTPLLVETFDAKDKDKLISTKVNWVKWVGLSSSLVLAGLLVVGFSKRKPKEEKVERQESIHIAEDPIRYSAEQALVVLKAKLAQGDRTEFYKSAKKCLQERLRFLVNEDSISEHEAHELESKIQTGQIQSEQIERIAKLEKQADSYLYGGIQTQGEEEFLSEIEKAIQL